MTYTVTSDELTTIADAIRAKGGASGSIMFPNGMANAIANLPTGGGNTEILSIPEMTVGLPAGPCQVWGLAKGFYVNGWQTDYIFYGDRYITYLGDTETKITTTIGPDGKVSGIPELAEGTVLIEAV